MNTIKNYLSVCVLLLCFNLSSAQDALFTQFHYTPTYFNPALAGCGKNNLRLSAASKMQWFNLYKPFRYFSSGLDYAIYDNNQRNVLNMGLNVGSSNKGYLNHTDISGIVGRSFGTNTTDCSNWFLSVALQAGASFLRVKPDQFVFVDQINQTGITGELSSVDLFKTFNNKRYFDFASGFVFAKGDFMLGCTVHHLNEPNLSFNGSPDDGKLPRKTTAHLSYRMENEIITLKPTVITQFQGKSSVITAGALIDYYEFPIEFGLWYRNAVGLANNSAFCIGVSWKWGESSTVTSRTKEYSSKLGLSYDADISRPGINTSYGSMEFGIQKDIITNSNNICPTSNSGICNYRFPWEFF
jgi:type IX secretion system PorP/SprF family membrane protein